MIKNIILDYGHGGIDQNGNYTTAPAKMHTFPNGEIAYEGVINRQIGGFLELYLNTQKPKINVIKTVEGIDATDKKLQERVDLANSFPKNDSIFVSIHSNASEAHIARGFEIFTTRGTTKSDALATAIGNQVKIYYEKLSLRLRFDFTDGDLDKERDFFVIKNTKCPAVLLECLFFDNAEDYAFLKDPLFQRELAYYVFLGIMSYVNK